RGTLPLLGRHVLGAERLGAGHALPPPVEGHVHGDAKEPGVEGRLPLELRQRPERLHEGLLGHVEGLLLVPEHPVGEPERFPLVPPARPPRGLRPHRPAPPGRPRGLPPPRTAPALAPPPPCADRPRADTGRPAAPRSC